ncbi:MAG: hypothetical protein N2167_11240 [Flavobacteriales bacterium]|nr:hypothetical protein [Flavobacteriales bacterium]
MKNIFKSTILAINLLTFVPLCMAQQTLRFEIYSLGTKTGTLTAKKEIKNNLEYYIIESQAHASLLVSQVDVKTILKSTYKDGMLLSSYAKNEKNGEIEQYADTHWKEMEYYITSHTGKNTVKEKINISVASLYFMEPKNYERIYSEVWGQFLPLTAKDNSYTLQLPNGRSTTFIYVNGQLQEIHTTTKVGKVKIKRVA